MEEVIELGIKATEFLNSDIGRYIIRRAGKQVDDAVEELKIVNPMDLKRIQELQFEIQVAEAGLKWIAEIEMEARAYFDQEELHDSE